MESFSFSEEQQFLIRNFDTYNKMKLVADDLHEKYGEELTLLLRKKLNTVKWLAPHWSIENESGKETSLIMDDFVCEDQGISIWVGYTGIDLLKTTPQDSLWVSIYTNYKLNQKGSRKIKRQQLEDLIESKSEELKELGSAEVDYGDYDLCSWTVCVDEKTFLDPHKCIQEIMKTIKIAVEWADSIRPELGFLKMTAD